MKKRVLTALISCMLCFTLAQGTMAQGMMTQRTALGGEYSAEVSAEDPLSEEDISSEEALEICEETIEEESIAPEVPVVEVIPSNGDFYISESWEQENKLVGIGAFTEGEGEESEPLVGATASYQFTVKYGQTEARSMLNLINQFRKSSDAWYWNSDNSTKTTCTGLADLVYDYQLEKVAMQRAAEIAITFSHTRPNGSRCYTAYGEQGYSYSAAAENIAAGYTTANSVFAGWREDDDDYSGQGHRRNMLSSNVTRIGIGHVYYNGYHYWVQEFARNNSTITAASANDSYSTVAVQIEESIISASTVDVSPSSVTVKERESKELPKAFINMTVTNHFGGALSFEENASWTVRNTLIASIKNNTIVGEAAGSTYLDATISGKSYSVPVTVNHVPVTDSGVEATCTKEGLTEGSHCSVCGNVIKAQQTVPKKAHTVVTDPGVEATCTKEGLTEGSHCSVCGTVIKEQQKVAKKAHTIVTDAAVAATCTKEGLTEGSHCSVCGTVIKEQRKVAKKAHTIVTDAAVAATCTKEGLTEGSHCSVCGTVIKEQQKVAKKAHTIVTDAAVAATCTKEGLTEGSHCSICNTVIKAQTNVAALGHSWGDWIVTKEATYESEGEKQRICNRDSSHVETQTIPKLVKSGFIDVQDPAHPYYAAIYWAAEIGITKGYSDGRFGINDPCTRGHAVMFLWNMARRPEPKAASVAPFPDVPKTHTYYKAVLWAQQEGITKGYSSGAKKGLFGVNDACTRGHIMSFIWRFKDMPAPAPASVSPFSDVPTTHVYYKAILWGSQNGVTKGYTSGPKKGQFGVNDTCTRGQIVKFLYNIR